MSRTLRRKKFNSKNRFFQHYWECFSEKEVKEQDCIEIWKYHSDNYYTKSAKNKKQFLKNLAYRKYRRLFKVMLKNESCDNVKPINLNIKWDLH